LVKLKNRELMKIGVIQLQSVLDPEINLQKIRKFLEIANSEGAKAVFLPEVFYSLSDGLQATPYLVEGENEHYLAIKQLAKESGLYLLGGSAATLVDGKVFNRAYNINPQGDLLSYYDKINLFACDLSSHPSSQIHDESKLYAAGSKPSMLEFAGLKMGMAICFDLRFPELFRWYSHQGAEVLSIPAAFTIPTGKAHWNTLIRARAIENQCYVVAAAQWGKHNDRISTYGHSMVVDPWGEVLVDAEEGEKIVFADLDKEKLASIRARLNVTCKDWYPLCDR
jgi:deaminated glutathione amidase